MPLEEIRYYLTLQPETVQAICKVYAELGLCVCVCGGGLSKRSSHATYRTLMIRENGLTHSKQILRSRVNEVR